MQEEIEHIDLIEEIYTLIRKRKLQETGAVDEGMAKLRGMYIVTIGFDADGRLCGSSTVLGKIRMAEIFSVLDDFISSEKG